MQGHFLYHGWLSIIPTWKSHTHREWGGSVRATGVTPKQHEGSSGRLTTITMAIKQACADELHKFGPVVYFAHNWCQQSGIGALKTLWRHISRWWSTHAQSRLGAGPGLAAVPRGRQQVELDLLQVPRWWRGTQQRRLWRDLQIVLSLFSRFFFLHLRVQLKKTVSWYCLVAN